MRGVQKSPYMMSGCLIRLTALTIHAFLAQLLIPPRMSPSLILDLITRLQQYLGKLFQAMKTVPDTATHFYNVLKRFVLRLIHLPKAIVTTISRWISNAGRAITDFAEALKALILAVLRGVAIGIVTILSIALLYIIAVALFKAYKRVRERRAQREIAARYQREDTESRARQAEEIKRRVKREEFLRRQEESARQKKIAEFQQRAADDRKLYRRWLTQCEVLLSSRETMTRFPDPPSWSCSSECLPNPPLKACPCTIERLYRASGSSLWTTLEKEKTKWHPDRFARCPEVSRKEVTEKAQELFKIIQILLKRHGHFGSTDRSSTR